MSEPAKSLQEFLRRWSRRKLGVTEREAEAPDPAASEGGKAELARPAGASPAAAAPGALDTPATAFDPASLPPIESINAASDIRAFLAPGVPLELTRAALRRAWVSDPNIRDFIGIAENQWDFTKSDGVPGFGSLEFNAEVRRMVAELHSATPSSDLAAAGPKSGKTALPDPAATSLPDSPAASPVAADPPAVTQSADKDAATQNDFVGDDLIESAAGRRHGSALPK